jgi:hypothetical protein
MGENIPVACRSVTDSKGMLCLALYNEGFSAVLTRIGKIEVRGKFVSDQATKVHKGSRYIVPSFLTWAVDGDWWSTTCCRKIVWITVNVH